MLELRSFRNTIFRRYRGETGARTAGYAMAAPVEPRQSGSAAVGVVLLRADGEGDGRAPGDDVAARGPAQEPLLRDLPQRRHQSGRC